MKITLRLIVLLVAIVITVAFCFSFWQVRQEEARLKYELEKRASIIADSLKMSVEPSLSSDNTHQLQRIADRFSNRERLVGVSIHDIRENLIVVSKDFRSRLEDQAGIAALSIQEVERLASEHDRYVLFGKDAIYIFAAPILIEDKVRFVLSLFFDAGYIHDRITRHWINTFWRASIQSMLITLATFFVIYLYVMLPIRKATDWIRRIRKGESAGTLDAKGQILLGPLAAEITQMAKSLEMARFAAEEEARLRYSSESRWTPERLKEFIRLKLEDRPLFAVSNREPYMHIYDGKMIKCIVPASGLVTALEPVLNACGGTWIAQGSGNADKETVDRHHKIRVPPQEPTYTLRRVWVTQEEEEGFYSGFSNEGLWPLCHIAHTRPIFRNDDWREYSRVNNKFADAVFEEIKDILNPYILIQDYHFALLPYMIKSKRPDARVAIFWHIPWPNPESFGICPWRKEILQGMLGADLIGFHTQFHCNNFIESVDRFLESRIDYENFTVNRENHTTWIKPFPISIGANGAESAPAAVKLSKEDLLKPYGIQAQWMGVGVDRLDYTKGILERFRAIEHLLDCHPVFRGRFTFVELGAPSRTMIPKYKEFIDEIIKETDRINIKFKTKTWQPILLLMKHHSHQDIMPFYWAADVCLVTSLHDGMNLVAKEYISSREDDQGVLVLSQFTGAARELKDALIINPYDINQTAQALKSALEMPVEEQKERMKRMRANVKENNIYRWAGELVGQLTQIRNEA